MPKIDRLPLLATLPLALLVLACGDDGGGGGGGAGGGACTCPMVCQSAPAGTICREGPATGAVVFTLDGETVTFENLRFGYTRRVDDTADITLVEDTDAYPIVTLLVQLGPGMDAPQTAPWDNALQSDMANLQWIYGSPSKNFFRAGSLIGDTDGQFEVERFDEGGIKGTFAGTFDEGTVTAGSFDATF